MERGDQRPHRMVVR